MKLITRCILLAALSLTGVLVSCATNPVSGRSEIVLISVDQEKQLGEESAKQVEQQMGLVDNPSLLKYVRTIGERLAKFSPYQAVAYQFQIVDSAEPNAFALPGGYVYISRGLLVLANSEDELAGVIGHEIGHVAARHSVQRLTRAAPVGIVTGITAMATSIISSSAAKSVSDVGSLLNSALLAPYSREQESDADAIGQELAAKAGWDPKGITHFLSTLDNATATSDQVGKLNAFLATHPSNPERIDVTKQRAQQLTSAPARPVAANRNAFLQQMSGLAVGLDAAQGVFIKQQFLHPAMDFAMMFPPDWQTINSPQYVAGVSSDENTALLLQIQEAGDDPAQAAQHFLNEAKLSREKIETLQIGTLPAARVMLTPSRQEAIMTWIALNDQIFQIIAITKTPSAQIRKTLLDSSASFHRLSSAERGQLRQQRLRIIPAISGETLASLLKRAGSSWDVKTCAIANNLQPGVTLKKGQLIKVAVSERYG